MSAETVNNQVTKLVTQAEKCSNPEQVRQIAAKLIEMSAYDAAGVVLSHAQDLERRQAVSA